jgi:hydrogenase maturation protease
VSVVVDPSWRLFIVGFGNPQRRDDGIGPYIVGHLKSALEAYDTIGFLSVRHPEPSIVEALHGADEILFVDATIKELNHGWQLNRIQPEEETLPFTTHHFTPPAILGMIKMIYGHCPPAWVLTVEGFDFGFGQGLTSRAKKRARSAISPIVRRVKANLQTPLMSGQPF